MSQLISCVICRLRVLGSRGLPVALEAVRPRLNSLALPHEVRECHSLFHMSFTDFVWSRRADWADGRSAFRPASTRCSRPLASTGSLGMSQLISCVFRRLRVSCGGKIVIRVSGRGASRVVDEWNSKTVTRPWQGVRRSARYPATASTRKRGRFEETQEAPLRPTSEGCCAYSTLPSKRPRRRHGSRRSCSSLLRNQ